ncbi:MAG TPA: Wadjet anti-phage system protein JetA family protein [Chthoniobacteraceae bacterium]|jgi:hypothetical protein|nr:Wadjet anti-phage system protein JetA family protein [Chthoniobacteraceae bacterium]
MNGALSTSLFREVRPEFFRILSGSGARLYVDALDALERAAAGRVQGLERAEALALIEEAVAAHEEVQVGEDGAPLSTQEKTRAVCEQLARAGWLEEEQRSDWRRLVHFHPNGVSMMQALRKLAFPEGVVFSDKLVGVCTMLGRSDPATDPLLREPWQHVESCVAALQEGLAELRSMQSAIERHTRQQLAAATLKENLAVLFDRFAERIGHACYAELVRARLPLRLAEARRRVEELERDAALLARMQAEVLRREPLLTHGAAMAHVQVRLDELATLLESVVPIADAVDRRTAEFTRRSLARFRYLQETTSENRSRVQALFEVLNRHGAGRALPSLETVGPETPPIVLHEVRLLAGLESLFTPRLRRSAGEIEPLDDEAGEDQQDDAVRRLHAAMRDSLTVARANRFVDQVLPQGAASVDSRDIKLRSDDELADLIACLLHAHAAEAHYRVAVPRARLDEDRSEFDRKLTYRIERFTLSRK